MPVYRYAGYDISGQLVSGMKDADNQRALRSILRREGVFVSEIVEIQNELGQNKSSGKQSILDKLAVFFRSTNQTVSVFTRQLAILLKSGIQLSESLTILVEQTQQGHFKQILSDIKEKVNEGVSLSDAMKLYPAYFDEIYLGMISIGESSGTLDVILLKLADFLDNQGKLKGKVSTAFAYPTFMLIAIVIVVYILMVVLVPQIESMYDQASQELPWNTRLLIAVSHLLGNYFYLIIPGVAAFVYLILSWAKTNSGRQFLDRFFLRLPLFGSMTRTIAVGRFSSTLATLLAAGVPVLRAMEIAARVLGNVVLAKVVESAKLAVQEGESMAVTLKKSKEFPLFACQMIAVGERSGQLEYMLQNVSSAYDLEVDQKLTKLLSLLEPALFLLMAVVVGFVVLSVMIPLFSMSNFVQA